MLELTDVEVRYGNIRALHGVSFEIGEGELVALIGSNGAGKTTTLRTISGLLRPTHGAITFEGADISRAPTDHIVSLGISHCPEGRRIFGRLTVAENLRLGRRVAPGPDRHGRRPRDGLRAVPAAQGAPRPRPVAPSPAASSRCSPSGAP